MATEYHLETPSPLLPKALKAPTLPPLTDTNDAPSATTPPSAPSSPALLTPSPLLSPGAYMAQLSSTNASEYSRLQPPSRPAPNKDPQRLFHSDLVSYFASLPTAPANVVDYYDVDFGKKVRLAFNVSRVRQAVRESKYGKETATRWKRGSTPMEERKAYAERQKKILEMYDAGLTDNSESESDEDRLAKSENKSLVEIDEPLHTNTKGHAMTTASATGLQTPRSAGSLQDHKAAAVISHPPEPRGQKRAYSALERGDDKGVFPKRVRKFVHLSRRHDWGHHRGQPSSSPAV
ncbi:hypothetical protein H2203_005160 [Taxawa tesnikishii (nom. ined.)]|nr:hypothetical protein H2203_005160 [Dothideales sp. JES 119]